ncbi:hypothetical protein [Mesorhizobium sp.]|uniref:hypothetical protein n=1 Tax=Mesorhizobium sp. TaxID=1871066 RepID=UPI00120BE6C0|nr:hypothetical protein [Mesorhizobium sp.]TIO04566.1 MAG: hypothetical protein E5X88_31145 [Mesorhizobium sp.]TIO29347.1 MAG: hypothetical protein E5X89_31290 [Mesorhizobium sp.]
MDQDHKAELVSAFDLEILRGAFKTSVTESKLSEERWAEHARLLFRDLMHREPDERIIKLIIGR